MLLWKRPVEALICLILATWLWSEVALKNRNVLGLLAHVLLVLLMSRLLLTSGAQVCVTGLFIHFNQLRW